MEVTKPYREKKSITRIFSLSNFQKLLLDQHFCPIQLRSRFESVKEKSWEKIAKNCESGENVKGRKRKCLESPEKVLRSVKKMFSSH